MEPSDVLNFSSPYANVSSGMFITQSIPFHGSTTLLTGVIYITVFLLGLVGNSLAIYVVLRHAKMKTVTNIYILNLAIADELYIIGLPFLTTQNVLSYWPFGSILCRLVMTADSMTQFTSVFCLTVMSVDRYLAVVHPIRSSKWRHTRVAKAVSAGVWAASFVVVLPVVIFSDVQETFNSCNMIWPEPADVWSTAFILYTSAVGFFGPVLIICFCYLLIVFKVKSSGKCAGLTSRRRSERKVTRMVMVIVLVFVLCWLPFFIINIVNLVVIIPESSAAAGVYFLAVILSYANSCANPLLYGFLCDNFKQSFRKVLCLKRIRCKANGVAHTDPSARRCIARSMPTDCAPQSQVSNHPGSSQATGLHISHTTADLHFCASACNPLLSTDLQYPMTAATITESPKSATTEIPTISTVTGVPAIF